MKVNLYRASGNPIKTEDLEAKQEFIKTQFDALEEELGPATPKNVKEYQKRLEEVDKELGTAYPISIEIDCPTTPAQLRELCTKYESITFTVEEDTLTAYILDQ